MPGKLYGKFGRELREFSSHKVVYWIRYGFIEYVSPMGHNKLRGDGYDMLTCDHANDEGNERGGETKNTAWIREMLISCLSHILTGMSVRACSDVGESEGLL